jgi:hypothetical protein
MNEQPRAVREYAEVDMACFESDIVASGEPAVMRGLVGDWPIVASARRSERALCDYIAAFAPRHEVRFFRGDPAIEGRFFYNADFSGFNFDRSEAPLEDLLRELLDLRDVARPPSIYAGAIPLRGELAGLSAENPNPLLDPAIEQLVSLWVGNRGRTATHWDLPQNIACVVAGRRRFTLFPPAQLPNLYLGPLDFTLAGQPVSLVQPDAPDFERFPRFREAMASAQVAVLEPGDALYLPSMWFHHVESLEPLGVLLNFWWRDAQQHMFTPLFTLLHAVLSIRDLPAREREIWRGMFDHYIFSGGAEAMEHVPEPARGVYGELTPERLVRLRAHLLHGLGGEPRRKR